MNDNALNPFGANLPAKAGNSIGAIAQSDQQRAVAEVQAKLLMAQQFPRDEIVATDKILNAFTRPKLAEQAKYQYIRGVSDIEGPSIRSAETIAQLWGNIEFGFREISRGKDFDGVTYSEVEAFAFDLQSRTRRSIQFRVRHWRDTRKGGYAISDERDVYELTANQAQRRVRSCILAVIPGDVVDAAMQQAELTLHAKADMSPEAQQKLIEAFSVFGVTKEQIEKRIQRRLDAIQPAQVVSLKKVYASLRDGMSAPQDWFDVESTQESSQQNKGSRTDAVKDRLKKAKPQEKSAANDLDQQQDDDLRAIEGAPVVTFAKVAEKLNAAPDVDLLDAAADLIGEVVDEAQRNELCDIYRNRRDAMV